MAVGFRKSLFGFNSNDVIEYIESMHKSFVKKEKDLNCTLENLQGELKSSKEAYNNLLLEKEEIDKKLAEFNAKYDDIERLSENIGKLYLVAQTNAKAIMENTENNAEIATSEVNKNLLTISDAHESLKELRQSIIKTSDDFVAEVDELISSLNTTRQKIAENVDSAEQARQQFAEVFKSITE
jgi:DNA repair exonuclease SbcCD ATPase subunit